MLAWMMRRNNTMNHHFEKILKVLTYISITCFHILLMNATTKQNKLVRNIYKIIFQDLKMFVFCQCKYSSNRKCDYFRELDFIFTMIRKFIVVFYGWMLERTQKCSERFSGYRSSINDVTQILRGLSRPALITLLRTQLHDNTIVTNSFTPPSWYDVKSFMDGPEIWISFDFLVCVTKMSAFKCLSVLS